MVILKKIIFHKGTRLLKAGCFFLGTIKQDFGEDLKKIIPIIFINKIF